MQSVQSQPTFTSRPPLEALINPGDKPILELPLEFRVAGTSYDSRHSTIRRWGAAKTPVRLVPEPDNVADKHAIAIHMRWVTKGKTPREVWDHIGYVPWEMSEIVNTLIGSGEWAIENAYVRKIEDGPDVDGPRVIVRLEGTDLRAESENE